ncbi:MAG: enoyl-CoA hydratase/isomerase family protein, partial [Eggerthellaceae bacterium]|nr:enoyl-CoA hydratase/isomerase family protein [Eggerthellaceae bacterium]
MEQTKDVVYTERLDEGIEVIVFNQPGKKNAISARMMDLLEETLSRAAADDEVRVIVIRGAGDVFSSGGDLSQSGDRAKTGPEYSRKTLLHYEQALRAVRRCPKPIIAMVDGYAV